MALVKSFTEKGKESVCFNGYIYSSKHVLKSGDISWRCTKSTHHPNIFVLMDTLVKLQNETYVKIRGMSVDFTKTDSKFALEAEADLRIGEISRLEFLTKLGHRFAVKR